MAKNTRPLETLYSVKDAAKKLGGVSKFTIYAWMSRGVLERRLPHPVLERDAWPSRRRDFSVVKGDE